MRDSWLVVDAPLEAKEEEKKGSYMLSITNCLSLMLCFILWLCLCSDLQSRWLERPNRNEKGRGEKEGKKQRRRQKVRGETDRNIDRETR